MVERAGIPVAAIVPLSDVADTDPETVRLRRMAAVEELRRRGERYRKLYGPVDAAALVRADRDHGHSV